MVVLEADLVDLFNPGDDVVVVGTMLRQWRPTFKGSRCEMDLALMANSVRALNSKEKLSAFSGESMKLFEEYWDNHRLTNTELRGRNEIIRGVCPQLYGLYGVKLALLL